MSFRQLRQAGSRFDAGQRLGRWLTERTGGGLTEALGAMKMDMPAGRGGHFRARGDPVAGTSPGAPSTSWPGSLDGSGPGGRVDGATLLLARTSAAPLATAATSLQPRPEQVAAGRRFVRGVLTGWHQAELADTACLLASEILTNAVRHTCQAIMLRLHHMPGEIVVEVADSYTKMPRRASPELDDEFGRGLTLVDALARNWGVLPTGTGKIVWFTLGSGKRPGACQPAGG